MRRNGLTEILAERDEQIVVRDPVAAGKTCAKGLLCLLGCLGLDVPPAVRDPVDVRIDADARLSVPDRDDKVRRLPTDAFEGEEIFDRVGDPPPPSADEVGADLSEMAGLGLVEADGIDRPGDRRHGKPEHLGGGLCDLPEPGRRFGRRAVLGAERKDAGHEHPKGVARLLCHHADDRRLPLPDLPAEKQERPQDVEGSASGSVSGPGMPLPGPASLRLGSRGAHVPASATSTKLRRRAP